MSSPSKNITGTQLAKNSLYGVFGWLLPAIPSFLVTPVVVERLGAREYGLYAATLGLTAYFFTLGVGRIATKYVAEYRGRGENDKASEYFSATLIVVFVPTTVILLCSLPFIRSLVRNVLVVEADLRSRAEVGITLAFLTILVYALSQAMQSGLQGLHRFDLYAWITSLGSILVALGTVFLVSTAYTSIGLLTWTLATGLGLLVAYALFLKRAWPELRLRLRLPREVWREVISYAVSVIGYQFAGIALLLFERGFIVSRFGTEALTYYVIPMNIALLVPAFVAAFVGAFFPTINESLGDRDRVRDLYYRGTRLSAMFIIFAGVSGAACGDAFLKLWLNESFAARSYPLLIADLITFGVSAMGLIWWQIAESFRRASLTAVANLAVLAIAAPLMIPLSESYGLYGVAAARAVSVIAYLGFWIFLESRFLGGFAVGLWAKLLASVCLAGAAAYASERIVISLAPGWLPLIAAGILGLGVYLGSLFVLRYFDGRELAAIREVISGRAANARL